MKSVTSLLLLSLLTLTGAAMADDAPVHFTKVEIPKEELRMENLSRLVEYRCDYAFDLKNTRSARAIVEYTKDGKVTDYIMPAFIFFEPQKLGEERTGTLSFAWHLDFHNLIFAQDRRGGSAAIHLPDFRGMAGFFFKDSQPEKRQPSGKSEARAEQAGSHGYPFDLYPVLGICGDIQRQLGYREGGSVQEFVGACTRAGAKDVVVIYLYFTKFDEQPCMDFEKSPPPEIPEGK